MLQVKPKPSGCLSQIAAETPSRWRNRQLVSATLAGLPHNLLGQDASDSPAAVVRMGSHVGDQEYAFAFVTKRHQAGVADDPSILLPYITRQGQRGAFKRSAGPMYERHIPAGAPHLPDVRLAFAVHIGGKA